MPIMFLDDLKIWYTKWYTIQGYSHTKYLIYKKFTYHYGGQTGIRTLETVSRLHTFQACAFDHSATCPLSVVYETGARFSRARSRFPTSWPKKFEPRLIWVRRAQSVQLTGPLDYESKYRAAQTEFLPHWRIAPHRFGGSVRSVLSAHN